MRLDDLAFPFRVEQIGETFRRVLGLDELRVVLDRRQREPVGRVKPVRIAMVGRVFRDIGRHVGSEPALFLPGEQRRHIGTFDDVGGADIAAALLRDALHDALAAVAFDLHVDAGMRRLEGLGDLLRRLQLDRGVPDDFPLVLRLGEQVGRCRGRLRRRGRAPHPLPPAARRRRENAADKRSIHRRLL